VPVLGEIGSKIFYALINAEEDLKKMITHRFPLSQAEEGMKRMKNQEGLKFILFP